MLGAIGAGVKGLFSGGKTIRGMSVFEKVGYAMGRIAGPKAGFIAAKTLKGAAVGGAIGGGLYGLTGNSGWLSLGIGAGAWMGGARAIQSVGRATFAGGGTFVEAGESWATRKPLMDSFGRSRLPAAYQKVDPGIRTTLGQGAFGAEALGLKAPGGIGSFGWFNPGRLGRNMAIGGAAGLYFDDPNMAVYGAVGIPAARFAGRMLFEGAGKGAAKFIGRRGGWSKMSFQEGGAFGFTAGLVGGGGYGAYKLATGMRSNQDASAGYFPGGVSMLGAGGPGLSNNHLDTEGLTLALHKNARRTRVM